LDCGMDVNPRSGLEVVGDAATLWVPDPWHGLAPRIVIQRPEGEERLEVERADPYGRELVEVEAAVREGRSPSLDRRESVAQARVIDALYREASSGVAVSL
jgi:xylose dehydrogenase (NAD/NADP)